MHPRLRWTFLMMAVTGLTVGVAQAEPVAIAGESIPARWYKPAYVDAGKSLFAANCASCHGAGAEGAVNWRQPDAEGRFPPPPLNGSGHGWHHPLAALYQTIMAGSPDGSGRMPAWQGKLSQAEVLAIIAWFQSHWPDEIYAAWHRTNEASKREGRTP